MTQGRVFKPYISISIYAKLIKKTQTTPVLEKNIITFFNFYLRNQKYLLNFGIRME